MFYIPFALLMLSGVALTALLFPFSAFLEKGNPEAFKILGRPNPSYFLTAKWVTSPGFLAFLLGGRKGNLRIQELNCFPYLVLLRVLTFIHIGSWVIGFTYSVSTFWS